MRRYFLISAAFHVIVIGLVFQMAGLVKEQPKHPTTDPAVAAALKIVSLRTFVPSQQVPKPPVPARSAAHTDYASVQATPAISHLTPPAQQQHRGTVVSTDATGSTSLTRTSSTDATKQKELRKAIEADSTGKSGQQLPAICVLGLQDEQIDQLLASKDAAIAIWTANGEVYLFDGQTISLFESDQRRAYSERSLILNGEHANRSLQALHTDFGVTGDELTSAKVRLMFHNGMDNQIIQSQMDAARKANIPIPEVKTTTGSFEFNTDGFADFRIHKFELYDGRSILLDSNGFRQDTPGT